MSPDISSAFASIIRSSDWTDFFVQSDTQLSADIFYSRITAIINTISPHRTLATKVGVSDKSIHRLIRKADKLSRRFLKTRDVAAVIQCQKVMTQISSLKLAKEKSEENAAIAHPSSYNRLTTLYRKRCLSKVQAIQCIRTTDGRLLVDPQDISEHLNTYFASCYVPAPATVHTSLSPSPGMSTTEIAECDLVPLEQISIPLSEVAPSFGHLNHPLCQVLTSSSSS